MTFFLDTETTGLFDAEFCEVAIVDDGGHVVLNTLANPGRPIPADAQRIHGITDAMVELAPPAAAVRDFVLALVTGRHLVIYNASYDTTFFPGIGRVCSSIDCAMLAAAPRFGQWSDYRNDWKWPTLAVAAAGVGHVADGPAHRALADALACRSVWRWLQEHPKPRLP
jgi:DNA polymerase III subunit epsilon